MFIISQYRKKIHNDTDKIAHGSDLWSGEWRLKGGIVTIWSISSYVVFIIIIEMHLCIWIPFYGMLFNNEAKKLPCKVLLGTPSRRRVRQSSSFSNWHLHLLYLFRPMWDFFWWKMPAATKLKNSPTLLIIRILKYTKE